jgi:hypothetical protein
VEKQASPLCQQAGGAPYLRKNLTMICQVLKMRKRKNKKVVFLQVRVEGSFSKHRR